MKTHIRIGNLSQNIIYEGQGILCLSCGRVGHTTHYCGYIKQNNHIKEPTPNKKMEQTENHKVVAEVDYIQTSQFETPWQTISFKKKPPRHHKTKVDERTKKRTSGSTTTLEQ